MTMAFTGFLRISLSRGADYITVEREEQHVANYLQIQSVRYGSIMRYTIDIDPALHERYMLKIVLQPLVENAIHHARKEEEVLHIAVRIQKEERDVVFQVTDDGCGIEAEKLIKLRSSLRRSEEGYGLRNVANRVRLAYGENYGVRIESQEGYGTTVSVRIPVNE